MDLQQALTLLEVTQGYTRGDVDSSFKRLAENAKNSNRISEISKLMQARQFLINAIPTSAKANLGTPKLTEGDLVVEHVLKSNANTFITGPGGTGKSTILKRIVEGMKNKAVAVVAFTGVAAMHVQGETVNSFFGLPGHSGLSYLKWNNLPPRDKARFQALDVLIIDEVSMLSADHLDALNNKLQAARRSEAPFGGVRVLLFGDPYQLPPVKDNKDQLMHEKLSAKYPMGMWFFEAHVYEDANFEVIELKTNHRAKGAEFIETLRLVRKGMASSDTIQYFNTRLGKEPPFETFTTIVSRNAEVDRINGEHLEAIDSPERVFEATVSWPNPNTRSGPINWNKVTPEKELVLKVGAQVMFIKNDDQGGQLIDGERKLRWANGDQGTVQEMSEDGASLFIRVAEGQTFKVQRSTWDDVRHFAVKKILPNGAQRDDLDPQINFRITQFPIRLSWAITIHKSQGQTYSSMKFDPSGAFEVGQTYVALSRATGLEAIGLLTPLEQNHIKVSPVIAHFLSNSNPISFG